MRDVAILLEDEQVIRDGFQQLFTDLEIDLEIIPCDKPQEYEEVIKQDSVRNRLKVLIMDLSNTLTEAASQKYKAAEYIEKEYNENRIPIFIHSGNLEHYKELENQGTVFKVEKSKSSIQSICEDIKLMKDSDFLDVFCNNGSLDNKVMAELHKAFINQFKDSEIKEIIKSVKESSGEDADKLKERSKEIFERIAIRSLYANWISAKPSEKEGSIVEVKLNSIEHYYRRTSSFEFWTGDIFVNNETKTMCIIVTPRCNVGHYNFDELLLCKISNISEAIILEFLNHKKGLDAFRKHVTDDKRVGERNRFLPPSPQFRGGFVDYKTIYSINAEDFKKDYSYLISLSDELTNDVIRKLGAYLMRGGISETDFNESLFYLKESDE
ncbi:hypothetical protein [Bacteroides sp.]|uniref:hypothetical protein n=1 Tax=Bacteroides sp. TaxID=29523 RepID=UPI003D113F28